jgi:hypothetical protein
MGVERGIVYNLHMVGLIVTPPPSWLATKWWTADRAEVDSR